MSDQPPPPSQGSGTAFCAECGAAMPAEARFCGNCGAAPPPPAADPTAAMPTPGGASTWQGVQPVIDPPPPVPASGPPPGGPPAASGPPPGGPPPTEPKGKSKTPLVIVGLVVLAALIGGAFVLLGGDDDADDGFDRDEAVEDEETTTTEGEETTTTEADGTTTSSTAVDEPVQLFDQLIDDTGAIVVEVPVEWTDRSTAPIGAQPTIEASTSLATFRQDFTVPAMTFTVVSPTPVDHDATIDNAIVLGNLSAACVPGERQDYDDGVFTGRFQTFTECAEIGSKVVEIAASNAAGTSVSLQIQLTAADSTDIADHIADTFNTTG